MLRDPELIKTVMIKEFDHFTDHNILVPNEPQYVNKMMLNLKVNLFFFVKFTILYN